MWSKVFGGNKSAPHNTSQRIRVDWSVVLLSTTNQESPFVKTNQINWLSIQEVQLSLQNQGISLGSWWTDGVYFSLSTSEKSFAA